MEGWIDRKETVGVVRVVEVVSFLSASKYISRQSRGKL
jgi:hypothetical protein